MNATRKELVTEIEIVARQIADIVRIADTTTPIPNSKWTVGEAAAHLVTAQKVVTNVLSGKKSPYGDGKPDFVTEVNKRFLSTFAERDGSTLAVMLLDALQVSLKVAKQHTDDYLLDTHYGPMTALDGFAYNLCHLLMHGCAITRALNLPLLIKPKHLRLILPVYKIVMPRLYDKKVAGNLIANFVIDLRGVEKFVIICVQGTAKTSNNIPENVDCYISIDPMTFFLVSTGFVSQWKALFTGKLAVWGKRPWLAIRLKTLFPSP